MRHPARYTACLLPILQNYLEGCVKVLDPFAGTGKLREIIPNATLLEIEPEWAAVSGGITGDATQMPFADSCFDAICTSPTYGNRMADHFVDRQKEKKYTRNTYRHCLGRDLNSNNSGRMQWGAKYKALHTEAWGECKRVLKNKGRFILNISNHIRAGKEADVTCWHVQELKRIGFAQVGGCSVETPRQRYGANAKLRVAYESILVFKAEGWRGKRYRK